jgi:DNA helicase-2/ATP-dependent DNA helicase PcrA
MTPSKFQEEIYSYVTNGTGHLMVQAYAGSGKSTTQRECIYKLPRTSQIAVFAFNRLIANEMATKLDMLPNVLVKTLNGFGHGILGKRFGRIELDKFKTGNILQARVFDLDNKQDKSDYYRYRNIISRLVGLYKHLFLMDVDQAKAASADIIKNYSLDLKGGDASQVADWACIAFQIGMEQEHFFDYDDQIFMPLKLGLKIPTFDYVFIDELQDLSPVQIELVIQAGAGGRIIGVGDKHQAIYGFRGADVRAMQTFQSRLDAKELPLSICYRCPTKVIEEAKKIVPGIEAAPDAPEGLVSTIKATDYEAMMVPGDWTICRITAPLVTWCMRLIRKGKKATIKGKDIGESVIGLIEDVNLYKQTNFLDKMSAYHADEIDKLSRRDNNDDLIEALNERVETLKALYDGIDASIKLPSAFDLKQKVNEIFTDDVQGIVFCTAHKSKGLETKRVFIIHPELMPHPRSKLPHQIEQEMNLKYVSITRSMEQLYWVK